MKYCASIQNKGDSALVSLPDSRLSDSYLITDETSDNEIILDKAEELTDKWK